MNSERKKIFVFQVDPGNSQTVLTEVNADLLKLIANAQKALDTMEKIFSTDASKFTEKTTAATETVIRARKKLTQTEKDANKEAQLRERLANAEVGSMQQVAAQIALLNFQYSRLSKSKREDTQEGRQMGAQLRQLRTEYRELRVATGDMTANVGNYSQSIRQALGLTEQQTLALKQMRGALSGDFGLGGTVSGIAKGLISLSGITTAVQGVASAFKPFMNFEYQMDKVRAVSGATAEEWFQLTATARRLGETTEYTASEVADLMTNYARLGFAPSEILKITDATLDLATATGEDLARSADVAGSTLRAFQMDASQMPRVTEVITASLNKSALALDTYADSMKYVAPIAHKAGVSIEQTSAMMGILADRGIRGSMAGTALRRILTEISISGKTASQALADLNEKGLTLANAEDEVGKYAMTALAVLVDNKGAVEGLTKALKEARGETERTADIMRDNLKGDVDRARSAVESMAISVGEKLEPVLRTTVQLFTWFVNNIGAIVVGWLSYIGVIKLASTIKATHTAITQASTVARVVETASLKSQMLALRGATTATKLLAAAKLLLAGNAKAAALALKMVMGPIGWLAAGIGIAVGALVMFRKEVKSTEAVISDLESATQRYTESGSNNVQRLTKEYETLKSKTTRTAAENDRLRTVIDKLAGAVPGVATQFDAYGRALDVNIGKVKEWSKEYRDATKWTLQGEIKEGEERLAELGRELVDQQKIYLDGKKEANRLSGGMHGGSFAINVDETATTAEREKAAGEAQKLIVERDKLKETTQAAKDTLADIKKVENNAVDASGDELEAISVRVGNLRNLIKEEKAVLDKLRAADSKASEDDINTQEEKVADLEKRLEKLTGKTDKAANRSQRQEENAAQKRAEFIVKQGRKLEDIETQIVDMRVAAYKDGLDKKIIQSTRAGQKELVQQQRANADLLAEADKHIQALTDKGEKRTVNEEKQLKELIERRGQLEEAGGEMEAAIITKNTLAREKILRDANEKELRLFIASQMAMGNHLLAIGAANALQKQQRDSHKSKINQAKEDYAEELDLIELQHAIEQMMIRKGLLSKRQARERESQENLRYEQDKLNATKKSQQAIYNAEAELLKKRLANGEISAEEYERQIKSLTDRVALIIAQANENVQGSEQASKRNTWLGKKLGLDDDQVEQLKQQAFQVAGEIANTITQIGMQNSQHQLKVETERIDKTKDKELKALDERKRKGVLSEKQYEKQKETIEKRAEVQKERAEREAFEREKKYKMMQVAMEVALGIVRIWAENGSNLFKLPFAIAQVALLTATGIAQTAAIMSAKYEQGGVVDMYSTGPAASFGMIRGRSHASGGNRLSIDGRPIAEVEGNETLVILRRGSEQFVPILSELNGSIGGRKFAQGGIVRSPSLKIPAAAPIPRSVFAPNAAVEGQFAGFREDMRTTIQRLDTNIQAVNTRIDNIRVHVVETDVSKTQNSVKAIVQQATY